MTGLPRELIANHLDVDLLAEVIPNSTHKIFIDPWLELAHPSCKVSFYISTLSMIL